MTDPDRDYTYLAKTFDAPRLDAESFITHMLSMAAPVWRRLHEQGALISVLTLQKLGDIDMQTSNEPVRDWPYFVLLELAADTTVQRVLEAEREAGLDVATFAAHGVKYLSNEVLVRPAGSGTAVPLPSPRWSSPPPNQQPAIEYIQIPQAHWEEYRRFMREVMGPVGTRLVQLGHSYRVCILERTRTLHHDATLPAWNRIHILWGEFDDPHNGFFKHSTQTVRELMGPHQDMHSALAPASRYRTKPRMSKNCRIETLCFDQTGGR